MIKLNRAQTPLASLDLESKPEEVQEQFYDCINNIPFIRSLIREDRPEVKDLKRDERGKAIFDICNPPLLSNMDYFCKSRDNYLKNHKYCDYRPSRDDNSSFKKWYSIEYNRIREGMLRPSDGLWIPGTLYYYMNYTQMSRTVQIENTNAGYKVTLFPSMWDGNLFRSLYQYEARYGGLYEANGGHHTAELAARGKSKSYWAASQLARIFTCGNNNIEKENIRAIISAYQKEYLTKDGTLNKFMADINFTSQHTDFPSHMLKHSLQDMDWIKGYHDMRDDTDKGIQNEVLGVTVSDNLDKLRGKRSAVIQIEEGGSFPNLKEIYEILLKSVEDGNTVTGQLQVFGTTGDHGNMHNTTSGFAAMKEFMYHPLGHNMYALPNVFDKNAKGVFTYFFGGYLNRQGCYDIDGNSDVTKALLEILMYRWTKKQGTDDPEVIIRAIAEDPITPKEAIIQTESSFFPRQQLMSRLEDIQSDPHTLDGVLIGTLKVDDKGKIDYVPTGDEPIRRFPLDGNKFKGACEFFQMPEYNKAGKVFPDRYISGIDPYDNDESRTQSLGSIFIMDLWTDKVVFEYTGRLDSSDEFYEICRLALLFYNARANYENNLKGIFNYFRRMNCLYLLTDTLEFLKDKQMVNVSGSSNNTGKGTNATAPINRYADTLTKDWLLIPETIVTTDDEGIQSERTINHIASLQNVAFIQELIAFNPAVNVDRVRAFGMLMLLRQDCLVLTGGDFSKKDKTDKGYLGNDDFFNRNYNINPTGFNKIIIENKLSDNKVDM